MSQKSSIHRCLPLDPSGLAKLEQTLRKRARELERPLVVAIDGRSGAGKSTLAAQLAARLDACVLRGDDFFAGGVTLRTDTPEERARDCIAWNEQRPVLEALRAGQTASYFAFDWQAFDGRLDAHPTSVEPRSIVLFEGVYSARPELRDLVDLRLLLQVSDALRLPRLIAREGGISAWERQWHEAEDWYFARVVPAQAFDLILGESSP